MDVTVRKLNLIHWITELDNEITLNVLDIIKEQSTDEDWWNHISDVEKASIEKGLSDAIEGKTVSHSEVKKRYEQWL
jgi:predicted transcriptional regulator